MDDFQHQQFSSKIILDHLEHMEDAHQQVLDIKSSIPSPASVSSDKRRASSTPNTKVRGGGFVELDRKRQLELGNQRLLRKLVQISARKNQFSVAQTASPVRTLL